MSRIPSEEAIAREMQEAGLDRFPAIRRIQQRREILQRAGVRTLQRELGA